MEVDNQEPQFAGTLDLDAGTATKALDGEQPPGNPNLDPDNPDDSDSGGGGGTGGNDEEGAQAAADAAAADAKAAEEAANAAKNTDYLKTWNERAGTQFQTEEELIEEIKSGRGLKEKLTDYEKKIGELSVLDDPFVRDIAKAKKAGIGIELYLEAVKMDVDKLEPKQVLREAFFRENLGSNPKLLEQRFEREYRAKYGTIGQKPDVAGLDELEAKVKLDEFNQEQEYLQLSFEDEVMQKRNFMRDWKQKNVTIPDTTQQAGMTDAQIQQYKTQVDSFVGKNENVEIPVGDLKFNFGLKDYKETLKTELLNLQDTLKKHGIDVETGLVDAEKFGQLLTAAYVGKNLAKPLSDWSVDARNIEHLKAKKVLPAPAQPTGAGAAAGAEDDLAARFGKGMAAIRAAQSQS